MAVGLGSGRGVVERGAGPAVAMVNNIICL